MLGRCRTSRSEFDALKHHTSTFSATMPFCCVSLSKPQLKWCGLRRSGLLFGGLLFVDGSEIVAASVEDWSVEGRVESCLMFRNAVSRRLYNLDRCAVQYTDGHATGGFKPELGYGGHTEALTSAIGAERGGRFSTALRCDESASWQRVSRGRPAGY